MIEIVALIFLTRKIGKLASSKGHKPLMWKILTVLSWIFSEVLGIYVALMFFDKNNLFSIVVVGLMFAITSYYIIKAQLNKLPDQGIEDDINNLGR